MATSKEYAAYIKEQASLAEGFALRAMMGEYVVYCKGKVVGGIYDNRLLVKPTNSALTLMPHARYELPYEGAKEQVAVENIEDKA
ncbi:MAG: competence protein TfoX, partial [Clostridia bacterium]|nr:competence protein TfoX [Clostridia bacterium]